MLYTDKEGTRVDVGYFVEIPNFPEFDGMYFEIVHVVDDGNFYQLREIDVDGEPIPDMPEIMAEPWKVQLI